MKSTRIADNPGSGHPKHHGFARCAFCGCWYRAENIVLDRCTDAKRCKAFAVELMFRIAVRVFTGLEGRRLTSQT